MNKSMNEWRNKENKQEEINNWQLSEEKNFFFFRVDGMIIIIINKYFGNHRLISHIIMISKSFWMVVEMFLFLLLLLDRLVFIIRNEKKSKIFFYLDFSYKIRWQGRQENLFNFLAENFSFFVLLDIDFFCDSFMNFMNFKI